MSSSFRLGATAVAAGALAALITTFVTPSSASVGKGFQSASAYAPTVAPRIFGHRGAAGYRPEHTSAGYALGAELGADYLEPDLVVTKDGYLVDRHEPDITHTTNVASHPEFAKLRTTETVDGTTTTGWFTNDFTLAQLETLRAKERIPDIRQHNTLYDNRYRIPTFQNDIDQIEALSTQLHRTIGIVPEIKHSTYFRSIGLPMEQRVLDVLHYNHLDGADPQIPVIIQSAEVGNLRWLHAHSRIPLMQLTAATGAPADFVASGDPRTYADITSASGLKQVATYATYLGPNKSEIVPLTSTGALGQPTTLIRNAHSAGLRVVPYTFRDENTFLPTNYRNGTNPVDYGNAIAEDELYFSLGVDGLFTDNSDTAGVARHDWIAEGRPHLS